jgi:hypothetical protein
MVYVSAWEPTPLLVSVTTTERIGSQIIITTSSVEFFDASYWCVVSGNVEISNDCGFFQTIYGKVPRILIQ